MKNNAKIPLSERLCHALDIPCEALPGKSYIEIHGKSELKLVGGGAILFYSPNEIRIALGSRDEYLSVKGCALRCSSYNMGAVGIEGRILSIAFEEKQNEKRI